MLSRKPPKASPGRKSLRWFRTQSFTAFADGAREIQTRDLIEAAKQVVPLSETAKTKDRRSPRMGERQGAARHVSGHGNRQAENSKGSRYLNQDGSQMLKRRLDLVGQRFGRLTVLSSHGARCRGKEKTPRSYWLCECDCGNYKSLCSADLRDGATQSCGCRKLEHASQLGRRYGGKKPRMDLIGQRYGRLTVFGFFGGPPKTRSLAMPM